MEVVVVFAAEEPVDAPEVAVVFVVVFADAGAVAASADLGSGGINPPSGNNALISASAVRMASVGLTVASTASIALLKIC